MAIVIDGEIGWDVTDKEFTNQLKEQKGDVEIEIASGGGSVFQGIRIFNAIKAYDRGEVTVKITSMAASIASYIALAADKVQAYDNAVFMIHNASVLAWGDHRELRKKADIVNGLSGIIAKAYISKTGKSESEVEALMNDETFFYGSEMLDAGFIDEILETESDDTKDQAVALASEIFHASLKASNERLTDQDYEEAAAMLKVDDNVEEPKPSEKEGADIEEETTISNVSKVNAINARLKLKEKELYE